MKPKQPTLGKMKGQRKALQKKITSFQSQKGAAPEQYGRRNFPDQTTPLGKEIIAHGKGLFSVLTGAKPHNITSYVASGTGVGEPLIQTNGHYNQYEGAFHVLVNGSFSDRIRRQVKRTGARREVLAAPYGETFSSAQLARHFGEKAANGDTVALVHLETSTAAQNNVQRIIETVTRVYKKKGLDAPLFVIDAASSPGIHIGKWDEKGYKVAAYMGTAKPVTAHTMHGLVYSTEAAEEEMAKRRKIQLKEKSRREGELTKLEREKQGRKVKRVLLPDIDLYFDHVAERANQAKDVRSRFTQPAKAQHEIGENLWWLLEQAGGSGKQGLEKLAKSAQKIMDERREIVQGYYLKALGKLGFEHYPSERARSSMLLGLVRPKWLENLQELLNKTYNNRGVAIQIGYGGVNPTLFRKSLHPGVKSPGDFIRINTYYPRNMENEFEYADAIIGSTLELAEEKGHLTGEKLQKAKRQIAQAKREAEKGWLQLKKKYGLKS